MAERNEQVWVTSAVNETDVEAALITGFSLRRTYTSRKIAVLASHNLSFYSRQALAHGFDFVFYLEEQLNEARLKLEDFAKVYGFFVFKSFDKCVFVSPSGLALKNCDEIFSEETETVVMENVDKKASMFLFKPSCDNYKTITAGLKNFVENGFENEVNFNQLLRNQFKETSRLDGKYCVYMEPGKTLDRLTDDICIVILENFSNEFIEKDFKATGLLGQLVANYLLKIRNNDVLPLVNLSLGSGIREKPFHSRLYKNEPIAIVGMSCRYPGSNNLEEFWNLLFDAEDGTGAPPPFRWLDEHTSKRVADSRKTNAGFLKIPVDEFDANFFGISPKEAFFMDPQHRLMHELVWEGLEDACIDPTTLRGTSGSIFMGSWTNEYTDILNSAGINEFYRKYIGNSIGAATARLSFLLGLTGPSIATESGCSAAMVAVHLACKSLQNGETNLALAGGVNLLLNPFDKDTLPMAISPDGRSKTFSEDANGFARAEGCGVLVLKRLSDAVKDNDNIWALIRGTAIAQEGISNSIGTPTVHSESLAMKMALKNAGVQPEQVSYVEAHGTGTVVGDPLEVAAIAKAYHSPKRTNPLIIGSVKTIFGHTESCSGITGIMKAVLCMHHEIIPAHRNFTKLNPAINLEAIPAVLPIKRLEWKKPLGRPRIAGVSSFGITGTDAHAILEEKPDVYINDIFTVDKSFERPLHLLKLSAKTNDALITLLDEHKLCFEKIKDSFADVAYSLNTGRADFNHRAVILAKSKKEAISCIQKQMYLVNNISNSETSEKICFLFTGQGSQYPNMAKMLYSCSPVFQMNFDHCQKILDDRYNINMKDVIWNREKYPTQEINRSIYSQTSIFCVEYALLKLWNSWGVKPQFVLGHSLGEFAAAVCAGILSLEDAITLVAERSKLIEQLPEGKMLVVQADFETIQAKLREFAGNDEKEPLDIAAINSSTQTVVAGDEDVVMEFSKFCTERNMKNVILSSSHAFHSIHMDPILDKYRNVAKGVKIGKTSDECVYISGMKGDVLSFEEIDAEYWVEHTREKVNFLEASKKAVELGCRIFIEIGPQPVLSALTMMNVDTEISCLPSLQKKKDEWETILTSAGKLYLKGVEIVWKGIDKFYCRNKAHSLPHYPFKGKKFWPEMIKHCDSLIHPLIGSMFQNASDVKIFQNGINLKEHNYIKDHCIGNTVIFPGAGYLEICLVAGLATIANESDTTGMLAPPKRAMKVENLMIKAPLALEDGKSCQVQTVVGMNTSPDNSNDWNDMSVKIFHRGPDSKWIEHANATFSSLPTAEELEISFDVKEFRENIQQPENIDMAANLYSKLKSIGLNFGPHFQSLDKIWDGKDGKTLVAKVKVPEISDDEQSGAYHYIVHPVVLDAMIQAVMMLKMKNADLKKKLYVPIKVGKYLWISSPKIISDLNLYIQVNENPDNVGFSTALLLDSDGNVLAKMTNVELIDTTVKSIESVLEEQTTTMPNLWEEIWHPELGPLQNRHDLSTCTNVKFYDAEFLENIKQKFNRIKPKQERIFSGLQHLVYVNFVRCLYACGWVPKLDAVFTELELLDELGIKTEFLKQLHYILKVLGEEGILVNVEPGTWIIKALPPSLYELEEQLSSENFAMGLVKDFESTLLFLEIGNYYADILKGNVSALSILFAGEDNTTKRKLPSMADYYVNYGNFSEQMDLYSEVICTQLHYCKRHQTGAKEVFRILEVGAGTGAFTMEYLKFLKECGIEFVYTFTDISSSFFSAAEKKLEKYKKQISFKKLNIEEDPVSQGFTPNYYDVIVASEVIHATRDLQETLANLRTLLRFNGSLIMGEQTKINRPVTYLFGLLDGFWRFEDLDIRPDHCTLSIDNWRNTLHMAGFQMIEAFPTLNDHHSLIYAFKTEEVVKSLKNSKSGKYWLYFHQENSSSSQSLLNRLSSLENRQVITVILGETFIESKTETEWRFTVRPTCEQDYVKLMNSLENYCNTDNFEGIVYAWSLDTCTSHTSVLKPYFYLTKSLLKKEISRNTNITFLVSSIMPIEGNTFENYHSSTVVGFNKSLRNERPDILCRCVDIGARKDDAGMEQAFFELWRRDNNTQVAYDSTGTRNVCKLHSLKPTISALKLPSGSDRFQLVLPETKVFEDLQFDTLEPFVLGETQVEIQIKASALNFRDIFSILKPSDYFKTVDTVGFDFAGIVQRIGKKVSKWVVGDQVFGMNVNGKPLPSNVKVEEMDVVEIPKGMSFCEASTLPAVVETSYYCLIDIAKITQSDMVLIHTATGGVGLSAIQICQNVGATIFATAGSQRKRNYLNSLGIKHVFHSRNTNFGDEILKVTNGRGVDVVLNSLTSDGFKEATLKACARNARFVEMSKLSIWQPDDVKKIRPDVQYTIADISSMDSNQTQDLLRNVEELICREMVKPIPYVRFDAVHIREALGYLQKAKHIGKVVCVMPEKRMHNGITQLYTPMFNDNGTYLITGGLGGIGFAVCQWMVEMGAKYVILAGRRKPSPEIHESIINWNRENSVNITSVLLDVSNFEECKQLINGTIKEMGFPALKGIMQAAGTLEDELIVNQSWETLSSTFKAKIDGTINLHQLTTNLNLEHFVMFSSITSVCGTPGQSNHAAGNFFEDTIAHYRHSIGLPATTINWGQWGEVGVATELDLPGLKTLSTIQALTGLEYALKSQRTQTCVFNIESFVMLQKIFPTLANVIDKQLWKNNSNSKANNVANNNNLHLEDFWIMYNSLESMSGKRDLLREELKTLLRNILKMDEADGIENHTKFQEMGVDSLMFIEIRNAVQTLVGNRATVHISSLKDCNTIDMLTDTLITILEGGVLSNVELPPTQQEVNELIKEDCVLPDYICRKTDQVKVGLEDISKVFLTGCTGVLGPYILRELTSIPQIQQVVCLMRPRKSTNAKNRMESILKERGLLGQMDMTKVEFVNGNIGKRQLGMETSVWEELCESVDAIFHCAATVQHIEDYKRRNTEDVRCSNVGGVKNILELASTGSKLKQVFCSSSVLAVITLGKNGCVSEEWPEANDFDNVTKIAYPISKFVGDVLMKEAILQRGIPGKVFRFPFIMGDSKTGQYALEQNHAMLRFLFMLKNGMMPSIPYPYPTLPVDICAEVSVKLFFNPDTPDDIFNISNMTPDLEQEFVHVAKKLGYEVDVVDYPEFCKRVRESTLDDSPYVAFNELYKNDEDIMSFHNNIPIVQKFILNEGSNKDFFVSKKIAKILPEFYDNCVSSMDIIYRDLLYAKKQGWFAKYNI